ncbi:hypothetical protein [Pseudoalteromonas phage XCL1123]|nr:hypothetical protein [Pseudoalteromonas phage XCL1123]
MEYEQGKQAKLNGKSIEYNPYRHKGTVEQYNSWRKGWLALN